MGLWGWFKRTVVGIAKSVWEEFKPFLKTQIAEGVAALLPYAKEAVIAAAEKAAGKEGEEKFRIARKELKKRAAAELDDFSDSLLNKAIEIAHGELEDRGVLTEIEADALEEKEREDQKK